VPFRHYAVLGEYCRLKACDRIPPMGGGVTQALDGMRFNERRLLLVGNTLFIAFGKDRFRRDAIHADAVRAGLGLDSLTYLEVRSHLLPFAKSKSTPTSAQVRH
jgi:hypothetical protein